MEFLDKEQQVLAEAELAPKRKRLEEGQCQRIFAEDRFRDLQKSNHASLFEYEKKEAEFVCAQSTRELKASLFAELDRKRDLLTRYRDLARDCAARLAAEADADDGDETQAKAAKKPRGDEDAKSFAKADDLDGLTAAEATEELHEMATLMRGAAPLLVASGGGDDDDDAPAASSSSAPLFRVNDTLSIFSRTEQKEVLGRLMAADDAKLVLKLVDGTTCQFSLADVASGLLLVADATPTDKAEHD